MNAAARTFTAEIAVRKAVGLIIGLVGPSSSGKTFSALRVANGIREVAGGDIDVIDTENGRALYYADRFKFNHIRLAAPFSPLDYLAALQYSVGRGAKTIVIDSMSHEHEGKGGVLEWHDAETDRLAKLWGCSREKAQIAAWSTPKKARRELINEMLQMNVNLILTYRAKEKIKVISGKPPIDLGWQPVAGEEYMYEMVLQALLPPNSEGIPLWESENPAEQAIMKRPAQFHEIFDKKSRFQLSEEVGKKLATWAAGGVKGNAEVDALIADYALCDSSLSMDALEGRRGNLWKKINAADKSRLKEASESALRRFAPVDKDTGEIVGDL